MAISGYTQVTPSDISQVSTTKNSVILGTPAVTRDGSVYRWTQNGTTALASGITVSTPARIANHTNLAVPAAVAAGAIKVTITLAGTAATADQYLDGQLVVNDGPGIGQAFLIAGNSAQTSTTGNVDVYLSGEGVTTPLTTASKVTLQPPTNGAVTISAAAATTTVVGATGTPVPANAYFWAQTRRTASLLSDGIITKNAGAITSPTVAGAVAVEAATTVTQRVGFAPDATVDTKYYPIYLLVD